MSRVGGEGGKGAYGHLSKAMRAAAAVVSPEPAAKTAVMATASAEATPKPAAAASAEATATAAAAEIVLAVAAFEPAETVVAAAALAPAALTAVSERAAPAQKQDTAIGGRAEGWYVECICVVAQISQCPQQVG